MNSPFLDPVVALQTIPFVVGGCAALATWPAWRAADRLIVALDRRLGDVPIVACAALVLATAGFAPTGIALAVALGQGAGFVADYLNKPRCTIERFKPEGTSAGVLFLDGPCPTDRGP